MAWRRFSRCLSWTGYTHQLARGHTPLAGFGERDTVITIMAKGQGLASAVEPIVVSERDPARKGDGNIHTVTVHEFIDFIFWFQSLNGHIGERGMASLMIKITFRNRICRQILYLNPE